MNEEFVTLFYSSASNVLRVEDENGKYQNNVCFSMVDDQGHYMICLREGDHDGALFYQCFHRVLMEEFGIPVGDEDEVLGECFSLQNLQNDIETMRSLNPTEVALRENDDEIPSCVKRLRQSLNTKMLQLRRTFFLWDVPAQSLYSIGRK